MRKIWTISCYILMFIATALTSMSLLCVGIGTIEVIWNLDSSFWFMQVGLTAFIAAMMTWLLCIPFSILMYKE